MEMEFTRRGLLIAAGAAGVKMATAGLPVSLIQSQGTKRMEPKLVTVPTEADIAKALKTDGRGISAATHKAHLTLWQGYANKTNEIRKALAELDTDPAKGNQIYSVTRSLKVNYAFAYGGFINHNVYFDTVGGEGKIGGDIEALIKEAYGSVEKWKADWKITGLSSRGWAYLGYDQDEQRVFNYAGDAQDTFPAWNNTLVLAMDVYEHAYFLDYQIARAKYIDAYFELIDWDAVNARLAKGR
jgi:Fe-Mn family superoxide dismutase